MNPENLNKKDLRVILHNTLIYTKTSPSANPQPSHHQRYQQYTLKFQIPLSRTSHQLQESAKTNKSRFYIADIYLNFSTMVGSRHCNQRLLACRINRQPQPISIYMYCFPVILYICNTHTQSFSREPILRYISTIGTQTAFFLLV